MDCFKLSIILVLAFTVVCARVRCDWHGSFILLLPILIALKLIAWVTLVYYFLLFITNYLG